MPFDFAHAAPDVAQTFLATSVALFALQPGEAAPAFTLADGTGRLVSSHDLLGRGPVVLAMHRGLWCPASRATLEALEEIAPAIHASGATLVASAPRAFLSPKDDNWTPSFPLLVDYDNRLARAFGLVLPIDRKEAFADVALNWLPNQRIGRGEVQVPAIAVIGQDGVIAHVSIGSRRSLPDSASALAAVRALVRRHAV